MNTERFPLARTLIAVGLALLLFTLLGCGPSASGVRERPIAVADSASEADVSPQRPGASQIAPPTDREVRDTIQRLFGDDVVVDRRPGARFVAGDFNGDASQDLVIAVKPVNEKLSDINNDVANWIIQDPRRTYVAPKNKGVIVPPPMPKPEKVRPGETLLAVIHGYGVAGWRDPMARQAYLLRESAGTGLRISQPSQKLIRDFGVFPSSRDVLAENLRGSLGVLYWTGAAYAWHPEK
jgi:hypothetical protein